MPFTPPGMDDLTEAMYSRQPRHVTELLAKTTAGIAGVGGLGSHVALLLARSGIGKLIIVDHDVVEPSNLGRQHYYIDQIGLPKVTATEFMMKFLRPGLIVDAKREKLNQKNFKELFAGADIIFECFDEPDAKMMAYNVAKTEMQNIPFVMASGLGGIKSANLLHTRKISDNIALVGDEETDTSHGLLAARVVAVAAMQVLEGIRMLLNEEEV